MAKTGTGKDSPRIALAQIEDLMARSGQRGDALRAEGLAGLAAVKRAKLVQTRRERARVAVRYGEASDRVARLDRQLAMEHRFLVNTRAEVDRVATPIPERDGTAWQVHGYLRSQDGVPRAKYAVTLFGDVDGRRALADTSTDKRGYFLIRLTVKGEPADTTTGSGGDTTVVGGRGSDAAGESDDHKARRAAESDRVALQMVRALGTPVYLGTTAPGQTGVVIDERSLHPMAGAIAYRDLTVANPRDDGQSCQLRTRLLGNASTRELHDLDNEKQGCQIAEIRPDSRFYFQSEDQARKLRYDLCSHCFGKQRSKR